MMEELPLFSTKTSIIHHHRLSDRFEALSLHVAAILTTC